MQIPQKPGTKNFTYTKKFYVQNLLLEKLKENM